MSKKYKVTKFWDSEMDKRDTNPRRQYARDFSKIPSGIEMQTKRVQELKEKINDSSKL